MVTKVAATNESKPSTEVEKSELMSTTQRQAKSKTKYQKKRLSYGHSDDQIETILAEGWGSS